jgi:hypothetical protein
MRGWEEGRNGVCGSRLALCLRIGADARRSNAPILHFFAARQRISAVPGRIKAFFGLYRAGKDGCRYANSGLAIKLCRIFPVRGKL